MKAIRFFALILALLLCSTLLISCNEKNPENTQETQNTSETVPPITIAPKTLVEHCYSGFGIANVVRNEKGLRTCELGLDWSYYYEYNEQDQLLRITMKSSAGILIWNCEHDKNGRATHAPLQTDAEYGSTYYFTYDQDGNMIKKELRGDKNNNLINRETYDANNKLIAREKSNASYSYTYDQTQTRVTKVDYTVTGSNNEKTRTVLEIQYTESGAWKSVDCFDATQADSPKQFSRYEFSFDADQNCTEKRYDFDENGTMILYSESKYNASCEPLWLHLYDDHGVFCYKFEYVYHENGYMTKKGYRLNEQGGWILEEHFLYDENRNIVEQ